MTLAAFGVSVYQSLNICNLSNYYNFPYTVKGKDPSPSSSEYLDVIFFSVCVHICLVQMPFTITY